MPNISPNLPNQTGARPQYSVFGSMGYGNRPTQNHFADQGSQQKMLPGYHQSAYGDGYMQPELAFPGAMFSGQSMQSINNSLPLDMNMSADAFHPSSTYGTTSIANIAAVNKEENQSDGLQSAN
jgi:hypothetical protein